MALKSELIAENVELKAKIELLNNIIEDNDDQDFCLGKIEELEEQIATFQLIDERNINSLDDEFRAKACLNIFKCMSTEQVESIEKQYC